MLKDIVPRENGELGPNNVVWYQILLSGSGSRAHTSTSQKTECSEYFIPVSSEQSFYFDLHFIQGVLFTIVEYKVVIEEK